MLHNLYKKHIGGLSVHRSKMYSRQPSNLELIRNHMPSDVIEEFVVDGKIVPVRFSSNGEVLPLDAATGEMLQLRFPHLSSDTAVLEATNEPFERPAGKNYLVMFSGGNAPGGHNIIAGIKKIIGPENKLYGANYGPDGYLTGDISEVTDEQASAFYNKGGFDLLGTGRGKIEKKEQFEKALAMAQKYKLDGIVITGGDDSNTNAAFLAEEMTAAFEAGILDKACCVVGAPKTIDGDLMIKGMLDTSFGFHSAASTYAEAVGNILSDTSSYNTYVHYIRLMGRAASKIALEVSLMTQPTLTLIGEEVKEKNYSLDDIATLVAVTLVNRAMNGMKGGAILIPEGLIEFIPEVDALFGALNKIVPGIKKDLQTLEDAINEILSREAIRIQEEVLTLAKQEKASLTPRNVRNIEMRIVSEALAAENAELYEMYQSFPPEIMRQVFANQVVYSIDFSTAPGDFLLNREIGLTKKALQQEASNLYTLLESFPDEVVQSLFLEKDPHGNVQLSKIPSEKLIMLIVAQKLEDMKKNPGKYFDREDNERVTRFMSTFEFTAESHDIEKAVKKYKMKGQGHFFGYEGRSFPSNYDANLCLNLGFILGSLVMQGATGVMAAITGVGANAKTRALAVPHVALMHYEMRKGKLKEVIAKALVETTSPAFRFFKANRLDWARYDMFRAPGPMQLVDPRVMIPKEVLDTNPWLKNLPDESRTLPITVQLDNGYSPEFRLGDSMYINWNK